MIVMILKIKQNLKLNKNICMSEKLLIFENSAFTHMYT